MCWDRHRDGTGVWGALKRRLEVKDRREWKETVSPGSILGDRMLAQEH